VRSLALALFLLAALVPATSVAGSGASSSARSETLEQAIGREVNTLRAQRGLRRLTDSPALGEAASSHSTAMLNEGFFSHESADGTSFASRLRRFYRGDTGYWVVGENLAMSGPGEPLARDLVTSWMKSPRHRANLLSPRWREFGIAARFAPSARGAFGGVPTWVVTLDFGSRRR
jgi:uncharacterized protein YkwD